MKKISCLLLIAISSLVASAPAFSATQQEMEQARTTAAKWYLRYANNMSAYLDDLNPKTMAELEGQLKDTEKENLKAFKAISTPTDYRSWNKEQLIEYWGGTFFKSPGLKEKGADCYNRVKKELADMTVTANAPAEAPQAAANPTAQNAQAEPGDAAIGEQTPDAGQEAAPEQAAGKKKSNTWTYIVLLGILIIVVIGLVIYASNIMRKNNSNRETPRNRRTNDRQAQPHVERQDTRKERAERERAERTQSTAERNERVAERARAAAAVRRSEARGENRNDNKISNLDIARFERDIADRDAEIRRLNSDLSLAKGDLRHTESRLQEANRKIEALREENRQLRSELEHAGIQTDEAPAKPARASFHSSSHQMAEVYAPGENPERITPRKPEAPVSEPIAEPVLRRPTAPEKVAEPKPAPAPKPAPKPAEPAPKAEEQEKETPKDAGTHRYMPNSSKPAAERTIFLGRVNSKGIFVRADRNFNPGNSYYRLVTSDGVSGTFSVINDPSVWEPALVAPDDVLFNACTGPKLNETYGRNEIITEEAGTAIFENGAWHVTRKAKIRYL